MNTLLFLFGLLLLLTGLFLLLKGEKAFLMDPERISATRRIHAKRSFTIYGYFFLLLSLASFFLGYQPHSGFILLVLLLAAGAAALLSWNIYRILKAALEGKDTFH